MAALAVASLEFAVPVRRLRCDPRLAYAIFDAAWLSLEFSRHDESAAAREAAERDCLVISVGIVARAFALGFTHLQFGGHDQQLLFDLIARIEYDDAVTTQWHDYLRERAREFVAEPRTWTRVEILARQLEREQEMDVSRIAALLGEPLPKHLVVPTQIPWHSTASGEANVELVWRPPGLTEIIELAVAARPADGRKP